MNIVHRATNYRKTIEKLKVLRDGTDASPNLNMDMVITEEVLSMY